MVLDLLLDLMFYNCVYVDVRLYEREDDIPYHQLKEDIMCTQTLDLPNMNSWLEDPRLIVLRRRRRRDDSNVC